LIQRKLYDRSERTFRRKVQEHNLGREDLARVDSLLLAINGNQVYLRSYFDEKTGRGQIREVRADEGGELGPRWFPQITSTGPSPSKPIALLRGHAMAAWFALKRAGGHQLPDLTEQVTSEPLPQWIGVDARSRVVAALRDLVSVASLPSGQGSQTAAWNAAVAGVLAVEEVQRHVRVGAPLWWRTIRVATFALEFARSGAMTPSERGQVELKVAQLLEEIHKSNPPNMYRARSQFEDCAALLPIEKTYDWVISSLVARAVNDDAAATASSRAKRRSPSSCPVRERMTAAVVAFERMSKVHEVEHPWRKWDVEKVLVAPLLKASEAGNGHRQPEMGLSYAAEFIRHLHSGGSVLFPGLRRIEGDRESFWKHRDEVGYVARTLKSDAVKAHLATLPTEIRSAAADLIAASILACSGILRRDLLEALVVAGINGVAASIFRLLADGLDESERRKLRWVREHAVFCAGFMAHESSIEWLLDTGLPTGEFDPGIDRATRMTALIALGDLAHTLRNSDARRSEIILRLVSALRGIDRSDESTRHPLTAPELRGAVYALATLRPVDDDSVVETLLLAEDGGLPIWHDGAESPNHDDEITKRLARWGLLRIAARRRAITTPEGQTIEGWLISPADARVLNASEFQHAFRESMHRSLD
jgi:hypothetical protein